MEDTVIQPDQEGALLDFSSDTAVDEIEATWTITGLVEETSDSPKGSGTFYHYTFESPEWPYPLDVRLFTSYTSKVGKDTDWVARQRGVIKRIALAALGAPQFQFTNPSGPGYIVGRQVVATTAPDNQDRPTLRKFKPVAA